MTARCSISTRPRLRHAGMAMLDVLVALLLLAIVLTGAFATLMQTMRQVHGALLTTRATDLAADLAEELRGATSAAQIQAVVTAWRTRVATTLPVGALAPEEFGSLRRFQPSSGDIAPATERAHEVTLRWLELPRGNSSELTLPLAMTPEAPPT